MGGRSDLMFVISNELLGGIGCQMRRRFTKEGAEIVVSIIYKEELTQLRQENMTLQRTRQELEDRCGFLAGEVDRLRSLFFMAQTIDEKPFHKDPASDLHCVPMEVLMAEIFNRLAERGLLKRG